MRLAIVVEEDRVLRVRLVPVAASHPLVREPDEPPHAVGMAPADGRHLHHLPVYELHPVVLVEDASLAHLPVLLHGKAAPLDGLLLHDPRHAPTSSTRASCPVPARG